VSKVYFVGCGPGDPELITIKAKKLIQKADVLVYSGSLIPTSIIKLCKKGTKHRRYFWIILLMRGVYLDQLETKFSSQITV